MVHFTDENVEQIILTCSDHVTALGESLSQCFDRNLQIAVGDSGTWIPKEVAADFQGFGLTTLFEVRGQGAVGLIPETLDVPNWCRQPNASQQARLDTLAAEWALNLFPAELEPTRFAAVTVPNLTQFVEDCVPVDWAATLELKVTEDGLARGTILLVWPLSGPHLPGVEDPITEAIGWEAASTPARMGDPLARFRTIPVQLSVRLAEKRIPVSQLLGITPGALITFNKSCEDQLDLYVNNALYCRGEAVKIGEKFGLKINQVGATQQRPAKVFNG